jgi:hypothetical protein
MSTDPGLYRHPTRRCPEPHCGRPAHGWSSFCHVHAARQYIYGHTSLRSGIREADLKPFRQWVNNGLARHRSTKGTANVLTLIDNNILNFRANEIVRAERDLARVTELMRYHDVTASDVLARVCLFQAYAASNVGRFRGSRRAEDIALGRFVLRLVPLRKAGARYATKTVERLAAELRQLVVPYADKLIELLKAQAAERHELVTASLDLSTPAEVPADPPRAGRGRRRRLGVQVP